LSKEHHVMMSQLTLSTRFNILILNYSSLLKKKTWTDEILWEPPDPNLVTDWWQKIFVERHLTVVPVHKIISYVYANTIVILKHLSAWITRNVFKKHQTWDPLKNWRYIYYLNTLFSSKQLLAKCSVIVVPCAITYNCTVKQALPLWQICPLTKKPYIASF
jgi:hypothetical protein